jgi:hypothetical protein
MKPRNAMEKAAFNKKRALFTGKMDLEMRKKLQGYDKRNRHFQRYQNR